MHIEDTQRLVTEIEMLKVVLYLVVRKERSRLKAREQLQLFGIPNGTSSTVLTEIQRIKVDIN